MRLVTVVASPLTEEAWAPFGWLPVPDTDPRDTLQQLHFEWADPNLNVIAHGYDEVEHTDAGSVCAVMFRHDTHTQALMPLNVPAVVAVAPASLDFSAPEHLDQVRAFLLQPLDAFVLFQGTWHCGSVPARARVRCSCSTSRASATPRTTPRSISRRAPARPSRSSPP